MHSYKHAFFHHKKNMTHVYVYYDIVHIYIHVHTYQVRKAGVRDLALVVSQKGHGATTVSATMHIAHMAGIKVYMYVCINICMLVCTYVCVHVPVCGNLIYENLVCVCESRV